MIIGVTGDTHNNLKNINEICSIFNKNRTDLVFHTGDISLPKSLFLLIKLNCPLIAVLGNNDIGEKNQLLEKLLRNLIVRLLKNLFLYKLTDKK